MCNGCGYGERPDVRCMDDFTVPDSESNYPPAYDADGRL